MKQLVAFIQKEFMEIVRNSKLLICGIIFALLGIMNPAIAKLTPWIIEMYSNTSSSGIVFVPNVSINIDIGCSTPIAYATCNSPTSVGIQATKTAPVFGST